MALLLALGCSVRETGTASKGVFKAPSKRLSDLTQLPAPQAPSEPGSPEDTVAQTAQTGSLLPPLPTESPGVTSSAPPPIAGEDIATAPSDTQDGAASNTSQASETLSASPSTSPTPSTQPSTQASPTPSPLSLADLQQQIEARLGLIARISFEQGQANLVSNNAGNLLGNNGGQLLSESAGSLLSETPGSYRLAQSGPTINTAPLANEILRGRRIWDAGGTRLHFQRTDLSVDEYDRRVEIDAAGRPRLQNTTQVESRYAADNAAETIRSERIELGPDGSLRLHRPMREYKSPDGSLNRIVFGPEATKIRMPDQGVDLDIENFELNLPTRSGAFSYRFRRTGNTENGTLSQVERDADGRLWYSYGDALGYYAGTSEVRDASGTLIVRKTRELEGSAVYRSYELGDGLVMRLLRGVNNVFRGPLNAQGVKVADVALGIFGDGTTIFDLAYVNNPSVPKRVGWGVPPQAPAPSPAPQPAWRVETVLGAESGRGEGTRATARFTNLRALVSSQQVVGRYFACDLGNHRIVRLDRTAEGWSAVALAGNGTPGDDNGIGADARFRSPIGLAIAPDDTLYVSEVSGNRIRRIRQTNTTPLVDTIAGDITAGFQNGTGSVARFGAPTGLALIGDTLYVAEQANHALRAINLATADFMVTTVLGDGTPGDTNGPAATVRLRQPVALARAADNSIWMSESAVGRIRRYDAAGGQVSTVVAGVPESQGWIDGPAGDCGLFRPVGIFSAGARGIFVTHVDVRAIAADGSVRTIAGQPFMQGSTDGDHTIASFVAVWGTVAMEDGSYLLTDSSRIRRLIPPPP